jgi:DNA-binding beta-propeller fold protein YncE
MSLLVPEAEYPITGGSPDWLALAEDSVWVNSRQQDFITRMDATSNRILATIPVKKPCSGFAVGAGTLWTPSCEENVIYRIDVNTNAVVAKVPVGPANNEGAITFGAGSAWMPSDPKGVVSRIDPATNKVIAEIKVAPGSYSAAYGYGLVWVTSTDKHLVSVIHPASNEIIAEIPVDEQPRFLSVGEGFVWTLNQARGNVSKIDPATKKVVATIDVGVPGPGGDITAGEGAVWVTHRTIPISRIDPIADRVTVQFIGPGGDGMRVLYGHVWLSNGRRGNVWRLLPSRIVAAAPDWVSKAQKADLNGDGKPDLLVEDLLTYLPGEATKFRVLPIDGWKGKLVLRTTLNGKSNETPFLESGKERVATFTPVEPRWIHYSVCAAGSDKCSAKTVVASPTTTNAFAMKKARFVPEDFLAPTPPQIAKYTWHILEPRILKQDYQALVDRNGRTGPITLSIDEDYGELKRHEWEFQQQTAYSWAILTPDEKLELACVYINPSKKTGYDASVRYWVTTQGAELGLESILDSQVREWVKSKWPFKNVAFPGRDISMEAWNALADAE